MIRKWLKFNTSFIEILKNSAVQKNFDSKWVADNPFRTQTYGSACSLGRTNVQTCGSLAPFVTPSSGAVGKTVRIPVKLPDHLEQGDGDLGRDEVLSETSDDTSAVAETPAKTELFELKGPENSAFLVEVYEEDLEEVREKLNELKGNYFRFDRSVIDRFAIKCMLMVEPLYKNKDQMRMVKVHCIASGSEEVYELKETGQFLFINSVDKTMRVKKMLEKFGYTVSGILYRFQPCEKAELKEYTREICHNFIKAVEQIPRVISVTHNV